MVWDDKEFVIRVQRQVMEAELAELLGGDWQAKKMSAKEPPPVAYIDEPEPEGWPAWIEEA